MFPKWILLLTILSSLLTGPVQAQSQDYPDPTYDLEFYTGIRSVTRISPYSDLTLYGIENASVVSVAVRAETYNPHQEAVNATYLSQCSSEQHLDVYVIDTDDREFIHLVDTSPICLGIHLQLAVASFPPGVTTSNFNFSIVIDPLNTTDQQVHAQINVGYRFGHSTQIPMVLWVSRDNNTAEVTMTNRNRKLFWDDIPTQTVTSNVTITEPITVEKLAFPSVLSVVSPLFLAAIIPACRRWKVRD